MKTIISILLSLIVFRIQAQPNALSLANSLLPGGITLVNATLTCPTDPITGALQNTAGNIATDPHFGGAVVLTTGDFADVSILNSAVPISHNWSGPGDPDLNLATANNTYDACALEIEFIPSCSGTLDVPYYFASEEYPLTPGKLFYDVAGVFFQNVTDVIPYASLSTSSVLATPYIPSAGFAFNGYTAAFLATTPALDPCKTYKIKMVVADGGDGIFDAAILLDQWVYNGDYLFATPSVDAVENCNQGQFTICKTGAPSATGINIPITLTSNTVATSGLDFIALPTSVLIPAGATCVTTTLFALPDVSPEMSELVEIQFPTDVNMPLPANTGPHCHYDKTSLQILDQIPTFPNITTCPGLINSIGGASLPGYNYVWTTVTPGALAYLSNTNISNPNFTYPGPLAAVTNMVYTVSVNQPGSFCNKIFNVTVTVNPEPVADFVINYVCLGAVSPFIDASVPNSTVAGPVYYNWNFGDGYTSVFQNPNHTYSLAGLYPVTLEVMNDYGCKNSLVKNVQVYPLPMPNFTTANTCQNTPVCFADLTAMPSGSAIVAYQWNFGDQTSAGLNVSALAAPCHTYNAPGVKHVSLLVQDGNNCINNISQLLTIYPEPSANFSISNNCMGSNTVFTDQSTIPSGTIVNWAWTYYDAAMVPLALSALAPPANPMFLFPAAGLYSTELEVTSDKGCKNKIVIPFNVHNTPVADFSVINPVACQKVCIDFKNSSFDATGSALTYNWDFGPGQSSTDQSPQYCYSSSGLMDVTLTVNNTYGCSDVKTLVGAVHVLPTPVANFHAVQNPQDFDPSLLVTDLSTGNIANWEWDMGDDSVYIYTMSTDFSHYYLTPGDYTVTLTLTEQNGCRDKFVQHIKINQNFNGFIPNAFTPERADGHNDTFFPSLYLYKGQNYTMSIFNRWGEMIWKTDASQPWDGTDQKSGKLAKQDVYIYKVVLSDVNGDVEHVGHVTLLR